MFGKPAQPRNAMASNMPSKREMPEMLEAIIPDLILIVRDFREDALVLKLFMDANKGEFKLFTKKAIDAYGLNIIDMLSNYGALSTIEFKIENLITRRLRGPDEVARFLSGLARTLTTPEDEQREVKAKLKEHPALIFIRILELVDVV